MAEAPVAPPQGAPGQPMPADVAGADRAEAPSPSPAPGAPSKAPAPAKGSSQGASAGSSENAKSASKTEKPTSEKEKFLIVYTGDMQMLVEPDGVPRAMDKIMEAAEAHGGHLAGRTNDTIKVKVPATGSALDTSATVKVTVRAAGSVASTVRVRFELSRRGTPLGPADTATYALVSTGLRASRVDTTDATGTASRTIRVRVAAGASVLDTLVVRATATMGGVVRNKPALKTILVLPAP